MEDAMTSEQLEQMTKDELYQLATDADVDGRSGMSKSELVDALADTPSGGGKQTIAPGTLDPVLAAARDEQREREAADAQAVEQRPTAVTLDPELARVREQTIAEDNASEVSATEAPSGR